MNIKGGKPPRWIVITIILTIVAVSVVTFAAWWLAVSACRDEVAERHDHRIMWEIAIDANPGPEADAFQKLLDENLAALECKGWNAQPVDTVT